MLASGVSLLAAAGAASSSGGASGTEGNETFVYVALGDSTGAGYGAREAGGYVDRLYQRLRRERPGARLNNLCVNGATSADVLRRQVPAAVGGAQASLVTLQVGVNDLSRQVSLAEFARGYDAIVKALVATGAAVVVSNLPDVSLAPVVPPFLRPEISARIEAFNKEIAAVAHRHRAILVDMHRPSRAVLPHRPDLFSSDGFHPSDAGYEFWTDQMWPVVKKLLR